MHPALMVTDLTDDEGKDFLARLEAEHRRRWALRRPRHRASDMVQRASGPSDDSPMARVPGGQPMWGAPSSQDRPKERGCPCGKGADTTIPSGHPRATPWLAPDLSADPHATEATRPVRSREPCDGNPVFQPDELSDRRPGVHRVAHGCQQPALPPDAHFSRDRAMGGVVRLASLSMGLRLWCVEVRVSVTLISFILLPTPGPYALTWGRELRHAAVFAAFWAPLTLWDTPGSV